MPRTGIVVGGMLLGCLLLNSCGAPADRSASPEPTDPTRPSSATASKTIASKTPISKTTASKTTASKPSGATAATPVIVIDPGHSGRSIRGTEPTSGLTDFDYPNAPEMYEVYEVSACVADGLRDRGYRVIMTKHDAEDTVSLAQRAKVANRADADLAISVHNDHSQSPTFQAVYSQRGLEQNGSYGPMWRGSGSSRTVFDHPKVARRSARYAKIISDRRASAQQRPVAIAEENFTGRSGLEPGNLALVQLLAAVPWVYNEAGALTAGSTTHRMTTAEQARYAKGLLDGVVAAIPNGDSDRTSVGGLRHCISQQRGER